MLWQYYGKISSGEKIENFLNNLKNSDLQWGLRGAALSAFAVIEGETCELFCRMAKRAGNLFNKKESTTISTRVLKQIQNKELDGISKPTGAINDNSLAVWLNFLLSYLSRTNPGKEKSQKIDIDPYSLSLLALESLLKKPDVEFNHHMTIPKTKIDDIDFKVAFSFPGEHRKYVSKVVDNLKVKLKKDDIFYDYDYQAQLAVPNLDVLLQNIYRKKSKLIVIFLCKEYSEKEWCGLEWRAIKDIIKSKEHNKIMFIRFDDSEIDGVFSTDGYIDANNFSEEKIAEFIHERIELI